MALVFLVALMSGAAISIWLRGSTPGTATSVRRATIYLSGQGDTHARNYALYANQGGAYDDVLQYLKL